MTTVAQRILRASAFDVRRDVERQVIVHPVEDDFGMYGGPSDGMGLSGPAAFGLDEGAPGDETFGADAFGGSILGMLTGGILGVSDKNAADLQQMMGVIDARMSSVGQSYAALSPSWVGKDPAGFTDWTNDWVQLQHRWATARAAAASTLSNPLGAFTANDAYDGMLHAIRQSAPPDGGPLTKGDLDELSARLTKAGGTATEPSSLPQPVPGAGGDAIAMGLYAATAPLDIIAQATGQEKPKVPGIFDFWAWIKAHEKELIIGGVGLAGLIVLGVLAPYVKIASGAIGAAAKTVGAGAKGVAALV